MGDAPLYSLILTLKSVFCTDKHIMSSLRHKAENLRALHKNLSAEVRLRIEKLEGSIRDAEKSIKHHAHAASRKRFAISFCGLESESEDWNKIMYALDMISEAAVGDLQPKGPWIVRSTIFSESNKRSTVVIDEGFKQIIDHVIGSSRALSIITFYGEESIGNSILSQKVYRSSVIQNRFKILARIRVPEIYNLQVMIMDLLRCVEVQSHDQSLEQLRNILCKSFRGRRYLIVMDDVRDTRVCDDINSLMPKNKNGSRIILTTHLFDVAAYANRDRGIRRTRPFPMLILVTTPRETSIEEIGEDSPRSWEQGVHPAAEGGREEEISIVEMNKEEIYLRHCSVFPAGYEFTKNTFVWLLMAQCSIKVVSDEDEEEEECIRCFDELLKKKCIVPARYDHNCDQMKYKVVDQSAKELDIEQIDIAKLKYFSSAFKATDIITDIEQIDIATLKYFSSAFKATDLITFKILKKCSHLQTLIIHGSKVKKLPSDLFLKLKELKVLCLSHTSLEELPSSIESSKALRYLDMSETPIKWLPESIRCLTNLQTLILDGCLSLIGLPKCINQLINLRHLSLNVARQLQSMPTGIGKLSKLCTLSAFLVGRDVGCRISELKTMNKLKGSLRILKLENVSEAVEAVEAALYNKTNLKRIELQWSDLQDEKNTNEEDILEFLLPPLGIQELEILYYSGGALPSWISFPSFSEMVSITLYKCRYCDSLPSLGELPSLKFLSIIGMNQVLEINSLFCRKQAKPSFLDKLTFDSMPYLKKWAGPEIKNVFHSKEANRYQPAFPKLEKLSFDSMSCLKKWTGVESGDFPNLTHLVIEYCPKFIGLPFLSHLNSLVHMEINYCPELASLPNGGLPSTIESLMIKDCPKLEECCCKDKGKDWSKVAHVPAFYIDNQKVS